MAVEFNNVFAFQRAELESILAKNLRRAQALAAKLERLLEALTDAPEWIPSNSSEKLYTDLCKLSKGLVSAEMGLQWAYIELERSNVVPHRRVMLAPEDAECMSSRGPLKESKPPQDASNQ